ncbi:hypothetical protein HGRIS_008236 [Hohenbuehelia grisea]|uniref:F-box domain-containing protein n=1 Tax=Hohenbuehelia grisea TaxID=104357 RepID=A0ABR3J7T1_9AGAR
MMTVPGSHDDPNAAQSAKASHDPATDGEVTSIPTGQHDAPSPSLMSSSLTTAHIMPQGSATGSSSPPVSPLHYTQLRLANPGLDPVSLAHLYLHVKLRDHASPRPPTEEEANHTRASSAHLTEMYHLSWPMRDLTEETRDTFEAYRLERDLRFYKLFRVNDLPSEIMSNILRYVIWSATIAPVGILTRYNLAAVCRKWRYLVNEDPTIWNIIGVHGYKDIPRAILWIERAKDATIDLRIDEANMSGGDRFSFELEHMQTLLAAVIPKLSQLRSFTVIIEQWPAVLLLLDSLRQAGEQGVSFNFDRFEVHRVGHPFVWIGPGYEPEQYRHPITLFGGAPTPRLEHLALNGVHINWNTSHISNLVTLDIRRVALDLCPSLSQFRDMLQSCPNLNRLVLDSAAPYNDVADVGTLQPIPLMNLKDLVICNYSLEYSLLVLRQFVAPNVRRFTIANFRGENYAPLFFLLVGRYPQVRSLTFTNVEMAWSVRCVPLIVKWLSSMPDLQFLRLSKVDRTFLFHFLHDREHPHIYPMPGLAPPANVIAPRLTLLECELIDDISQLCSFVRARADINAPFQRVFLLDALARLFNFQQAKYLRSMCPVTVKPVGASNPEERAIFED